MPMAVERVLGVKLSAIDDRRVRFVTHRDVGDDDLDLAIERLRRIA